MWYGGSGFAFQEQGKEWHHAKHQITGTYVKDWSRRLLVQLCGGMIHGPSGKQLELLNLAKVLKNTRCHRGVVFGQPAILRTQPTLENQLRGSEGVCAMCPLDGHVGEILHAEG